MNRAFTAATRRSVQGAAAAIVVSSLLAGHVPSSMAAEAERTLLFIEVQHDLGYFEVAAQIRSVDDPDRFYKVNMWRGNHHNPIEVPPGRYYFEGLYLQRTLRPVSTPESWFEVKEGCFNYAGTWRVLVVPTQGQVKRGETLSLGYPMGIVDRTRDRLKQSIGSTPVCIAMLGQPAKLLVDE